MITVLTSTFFVKGYAYTYDALPDKYEMTSCSLETEWRVSHVLNIKTVNISWIDAFRVSTPNDTPVICDEGTFTYGDYKNAFTIEEAERILALIKEEEE